jgi:hypothetical protein
MKNNIMIQSVSQGMWKDIIYQKYISLGYFIDLIQNPRKSINNVSTY